MKEIWMFKSYALALILKFTRFENLELAKSRFLVKEWKDARE